MENTKSTVNVIKGINFLKDCTKSLMLANNVTEYQDGMIISHVTYNENITANTHKVHKATITHDGTLSFFYDKLDDMFWDFAARTLKPSEYIGCSSEELSKISYLIGDVIVEQEYNVPTEKLFPMMRQTITIPYEVIINESK